MEKFTKEQRSYIMSRIRSRDTKPELQLRKFLYARGMRGYRIRNKLPGSPDIVFTKQKVAIFVDGCFWHGCPLCYRQPQNNAEFWTKKLTNNVLRDRKVDDQLTAAGWTVIRFWEHVVMNDIDSCVERIMQAISRGTPNTNA